MKNKENNRELIGNFFRYVWKDEIVNFEEANKELEKLRGKPIILAHNHFGLPDGPHEAPNSFRFKSIREREVTLAVTKYLYTYAQFLNNTLGLEMNLIGVVTPFLENRENFNGKYDGRRGEGLILFHKKAKSTLGNMGAVEVNPQATRVKGGMGEPGENNILMQSLLKFSENLNPYVIPVGMWVEGKRPEEVYGLNFRSYKLRYGKPMAASEIKQLLKDHGEPDADNFKGADKIVYAMIRELVPESYR